MNSHDRTPSVDSMGSGHGVDRRHFVWGDYLVWHFCHGGEKKGRVTIVPGVGGFPEDESVYGVRDLAGSQTELTKDFLTERYVSRRGGSWRELDPTHFRAAERIGIFRTGRDSGMGFRLVVELPKE